MYSALDISIYQTVHDFPGGAAALSKAIGLPPSSISNKANMAMDERHFSPSELLALMLQTADFRVLYALASDCGHVCAPSDGTDDRPESCLFQLFAGIGKEHGELASVLIEASRNGVHSANERKRLVAEALDVIRALQVFIRSVQEVGDDAIN